MRPCRWAIVFGRSGRRAGQPTALATCQHSMTHTTSSRRSGIAMRRQKCHTHHGVTTPHSQACRSRASRTPAPGEDPERARWWVFWVSPMQLPLYHRRNLNTRCVGWQRHSPAVVKLREDTEARSALPCHRPGLLLACDRRPVEPREPGRRPVPLSPCRSLFTRVLGALCSTHAPLGETAGWSVTRLLHRFIRLLSPDLPQATRRRSCACPSTPRAHSSQQGPWTTRPRWVSAQHLRPPPPASSPRPRTVPVPETPSGCRSTPCGGHPLPVGHTMAACSRRCSHPPLSVECACPVGYRNTRARRGCSPLHHCARGTARGTLGALPS